MLSNALNFAWRLTAAALASVAVDRALTELDHRMSGTPPEERGKWEARPAISGAIRNVLIATASTSIHARGQKVAKALPTPRKASSSQKQSQASPTKS